ncbi:hypothetical protein PM082_017317 [Marasmius tenuissimus]|nr:hypothetical protein PM082_017317 [Marasmius tenuissimus]
MQSQDFVFDPRPNYPLLVTAKRYTNLDVMYPNDSTAFTLVFLHGVGFHKEQWEPTLGDTIKLVDENGKQLKIREIWAIDAPNHGDAGVLNEETLSWGYEQSFRWEEYGRATHSLLAGLGKGIDTDFRKHRLVGIGHSMGAVGVLLSMNFSPQVKFEAVVLVEIMTMSKEASIAGTTLDTNPVAKSVLGRRDIWLSKEEAYSSLKSRLPWKTWDDRVLRKFVEYGLRSLPSKEYPNISEGVTLKCTRKQEAACFLDAGHSLVYRNFKDFTKRVPVHLIYGAVDDVIPRRAKEEVINAAIGGVQNLASFQRIPHGGHLSVQTHPAGVAEAIYRALTEFTSMGLPKL